MALIKCSECSKEVSDQAASCPNCGISISKSENTIISSNQVKKTELGEKSRKVAQGMTLIIMGILAIFASIPLMAFIIGFFSLFGAIAMIVLGSTFTSWSRPAICPYCEKDQRIAESAQSLKCNACRKISVRKDNSIETVPN